jgi:hypothetical protein
MQRLLRPVAYMVVGFVATMFTIVVIWSADRS